MSLMVARIVNPKGLFYTKDLYGNYSCDNFSILMTSGNFTDTYTF